MLVQGIPALGVYEDLVKEFALYGAVEEYRLLDEYPAEEFTEVMWIKFVKIQSARLAKRKLDDYEFCGGKLHVCYAPEYETVEDARAKLEDRRRAVARRIRQLAGKGNAESVSVGAESEKLNLSESSNLSLVESSSVDVAATGSQRDSCSVGPSLTATQPLPPPPPPPLPSVIHPPDPASINYFPSLPPPPVEQFPVRLPPHHMHPDVRWRLHSAAARNLVGVPRHFHPPPVFPPTPHLIRPSYQFSPDAQRGHTPHSRTTRHPVGSASGKSSPSSLSAASETVSSTSAGKSAGTPTVRDFKAKGAVPRFVPRQLRTAHATISSDKVPRNPDPVIEELKQNAFVLSSRVQGPSLPSQIEQKRKEFQTSETGSESIDKTVHTIRQKITQLSDVSPPVKKVKRKEV